MKYLRNIPYVWGLSAFPVELKKELPEISAVYFVTKERNDWEVLYVGSTINLKHRFVDHHRLSQFLELTNCQPETIFIRYCPVPQRALRTVEKRAIVYYSPRLNYTKVLKLKKKEPKTTKRYKTENLMLKIENAKLRGEILNLRLRK